MSSYLTNFILLMQSRNIHISSMGLFIVSQNMISWSIKSGSLKIWHIKRPKIISIKEIYSWMYCQCNNFQELFFYLTAKTQQINQDNKTWKRISCTVISESNVLIWVYDMPYRHISEEQHYAMCDLLSKWLNRDALEWMWKAVLTLFDTFPIYSI